MGCDIHAIIEKKDKYGFWTNAGDPEIGRDYEMYSVLANVRNSDNIPFISEAKGIPDDATSEFIGFSNDWGCDGHSHSWITLEEIKNFDIEQEFYDSRLILSKDKKGKITSTCSMTTGETLGVVGKRKIFGLWGRDSWNKLIKKLEKLRLEKDDKSVRLVFFFDN